MTAGVKKLPRVWQVITLSSEKGFQPCSKVHQTSDLAEQTELMHYVYLKGKLQLLVPEVLGKCLANSFGSILLRACSKSLLC